MLKRFTLLSLILLINLSIFGQAEKTGWKIYTVGRQKISISLPKLPTVIRNLDNCRETGQESYYAYEKEIVYALTIYYKLKERNFKNCEQTELFSEQTYQARLAALKKDAAAEEKASGNPQNRELTILHAKTADFWVYNDLKNNRWFELSAIHRENTTIDAKGFANSLRFEPAGSGIEIGDGSPVTLGDIDTSPPGIRTTEPAVERGSGSGTGIGSGISTGGSGTGIGSGTGTGSGNGTSAAADNLKPAPPKKTEISDKPGTSLPLSLVAKPRANYTDAARVMQTQGTVTLRVVFQANGGIGSVTVVGELGYGLTEQAVLAAKKIVFFPAKSNGVLMTVTKQVQYSFTIY